MGGIIREIPEEQRPYEKCQRFGCSTLSDSELLAVILRTGTAGSGSVSLAHAVLQKMDASSYPGIQGLMHCSVSDLMSIHGIGKVKAIQLLCIGELAKRIGSASARKALSFHNPGSVAEYYMETLRHEEQERMVCMMFDSKNRLMAEQVLSKGTVNTTVITPREIFLEALRSHAVSIILVHNHPSGDPAPSKEDCFLTERIVRAGELVGIPLLDHLIIGDGAYYSFQEDGALEV